MTAYDMRLDDLTAALRRCAGQNDAVDLDATALDLTFTELGYDSIALLETCGLIEREHGIELGDSTIEEARTPRTLLALINAQLAAGRGEVEHQITVEAPAAVVYQIIADAESWPRIFPPVVHVERIERTADSERLSIWATGNGKPSGWTSARQLDPAGKRVEFRQETCATPVAAMSGSWLIEPVADAQCLVRLVHQYSAVDDDPAGTSFIAQAVDDNSQAELAALKAWAEADPAQAESLLLSFDDTVWVDGAMADVYDYLNEAWLWAERLPHVDRISLTEQTPGLQYMTMETTIKDGSPHTTTSVRVCFPPNRIVYKQVGLPAPLTVHTGYWLLGQEGGRVCATSHHTAVLNPAHIPVMLGQDATIEQARGFIRDALSTNSLSTLRHAKQYAESRR